jgi:predicted HicB family RNase H-like nuclease
MSKIRTTQWLEEQTGQSLDPLPNEAMRHLSMRLPVELHQRLETLAAGQGESVSQVARRLLERGIEDRKNPNREALDQAIATLEHFRSAIPPSAA